MTGIEDRIESLEQSVRVQQDSIDWMRHVDWKSSMHPASVAIASAERTIETFQKLIDELKSRL